MTRTIGMLIFEDVEELDFVGPWEVFTMVNTMIETLNLDKAGLSVVTISQHGGTVRCAKGLKVIADHSFASCPKLDVLLVPGGMGTRKLVSDAAHLAFVDKVAAGCTWVTSVCTGSLVLTAAGPARGKTVTTHWAFVPELKARNEAKTVRDDMRYVRDGNVVTAAGVSAGIDMALWLVGQLYDPDTARLVQKGMEYDPAPPYQAAV